MEESLQEQKQVIEALQRLAASVKDFKDNESSVGLSHYRELPEAVKESYNLFLQGAQLIHSTSTKYNLLGKLDAKEQMKALNDILQGCQVLGTGCLVLHDDQTGCAKSTRRHSKRATLAIILTVTQLVSVWVDQSAQGKDNNLGAQKTGAVWEKCNVILEKRLPQGNRNCMRRDLLTYTKDCVDTLEEFQELIDLGPMSEEQRLKVEASDATPADDSSPWDFLSSGNGTQYSQRELVVTTNALYLFKISRGCLNISLQTMEELGGQIKQDTEKNHAGTILALISTLFDAAEEVGKGVTDLGAAMYPPLQLESFRHQVTQQCTAINNVLSAVYEVNETSKDANSGLQELALDTRLLFSKIEISFGKRKTVTMDSLAEFER